MGDIPATSNFYSSLHTTLSREQVAGLYGALGWRVRKCGWTEYEVCGPWAELVIEAESPMLMHGPVADVLAHAEELLAPLRAAGVSFTSECYGPGGKLLREFKWDAAFEELSSERQGDFGGYREIGHHEPAAS